MKQSHDGCGRPAPSLESSIRGCWLGKNIGGTLGAPFEGTRELLDIEFYVQKDLGGNPEPNDDLDLQLVWLVLAEYYGTSRLTSRLLGEYWINNITGPWNEYAVCRRNCRLGFFPPLSGVCNNEHWQWSNGAWIRSELWACLFPGNPDEAIRFAWLDASCDHAGEGIYAELFTAAVESAAFVEKDLRKLVGIGLSKIPDQCRIRENVQLVCSLFDAGRPWQEVRNEVVKRNEDIGFFQAPANIAFMVIGLLYGGGDFGKTVCLANNCGDDTDCTAATAGAILGIIQGAEGIPGRWIEPIGDRIITKAINPFGLPLPVPGTVTELTRRVLALGEALRLENPALRRAAPDLTDRTAAGKLWEKSSFELCFAVPYAAGIGVEYLDGPWLQPGSVCRVRVWVHAPISSFAELRFRWEMPELWHCSPGEASVAGLPLNRSCVDFEITPPETLSDAMSYLQLRIFCNDRCYPVTLDIPFQTRGAFHYPKFEAKTNDEVHAYRDACYRRISLCRNEQ